MCIRDSRWVGGEGAIATSEGLDLRSVTSAAGDLVDGFVEVLGPFCGWERFRCLLDMLVAGEAELLLVARVGDLIHVYSEDRGSSA